MINVTADKYIEIVASMFKILWGTFFPGNIQVD